MCFIVVVGNDDLGIGVEFEGNGENINIEKFIYGRSIEGYFIDMF